MKGLILKDIINLKNYIKTLSILFIFFFIISIVNNNAMLVAGITVALFSMLTIYTFSYDEASNWQLYALSLPLNRKSIVYSKYVLMIVFSVFSIVISFILSYLLNLYTKQFSVPELLLAIYCIFAFMSLVLSVILPIIFKYGADKTRLLMLFIFFLPTAFLLLASSLNLPMPTEAQLFTLLLLSPLIIAISFFISITLSKKFYMKKNL